MFFNDNNDGNQDKIKFLICFILIIFIMGVFTFVNLNKNKIVSENKPQEAATFTPKEEEKVSTGSILAVGDIMVYDAQLNAQYDDTSHTYDFKNNFDYVKKYISGADYSISNLETTLTGNEIYRYSSYPKFNSPNELADALKYAGFDLISTGNNHAYDKGDLSIKNTLATLKKKNLDVVGTREDNDKEYLIKNINGINVGITSYTFGKIINDNKYLNDTKISDEYKDNINIFDSTNVDTAFENINSTLEKMSDADLKIVYLHWGDKHYLNINTFQEKLAQKLCDAGVDVIIGSHPHVVQKLTTIKSSDNKHETVVAYSLGNFLSNQTRKNFSKYNEDGLMIDINISKNNKDNKAKVTKVNCIPTWLNKYYNNETKKYVYEIVPLADKTTLDKMDNLNKNKAKESYENTSSQIKTSDLISVVENPFEY